MSNQERRNYAEDVHILLGFLRKKLNTEDTRARCIRRIEKSPEDLEIIKRELEIIGGNWRVHRTVNRRSTKKAFKKFQHYIIDNPDCCTYLDSIWKTVLLQTDSRAEKRFMLDIDSKNEAFLANLSEIISGVPILEKQETPNGWHWITLPFDRRVLIGFENVTVLTDGYIYLCSINGEECK